jgi:phosphate starvation-inducible PhoH-like protein
MARKLPAKRATRPNPREDRNQQPRQEQKFNIVPIKKVTIVPKSVSQEIYLDALEDTDKSIVIATGPAGTGKTFLPTVFAIRELQKGDIDKIVVIRPAVSVDDEQHGYLPGNIVEKLTPWVAGILDVFKEHYPLPVIIKMIESGTIEFVPVAFVRGRTFKRSIVIFDEAQNSLPTAMKAVLTRIGDGSRIFVTGDMEQHDRGHAVNGLRDFIAKLRRTGSKTIAHCEFSVEDIERHPCVSEILRIYDLN